MDNKDKIGSPDRDRISLGEDHEVRYWTERFNVTKEQLKAAVDAVGDRAEQVKEYLNKK
jgi:hypothetical protein